MQGVSAAVNRAARQTDRNPSDAQKASGNYAKGKVRIAGLEIAIENPKGGQRSGVDKGGKPWSVTMPAHYGYVLGTRGADKDHVDCYIGPAPDSPKVYVVDQVDAKTGKFDEHKCILGYTSKDDALKTYEKAFSDGKGKDRVGSITELSMDRFKDWLRNGNTKAPMSKTRSSNDALAVARTYAQGGRVGYAEGGSPADPGFTVRSLFPSNDMLERMYSGAKDIGTAALPPIPHWPSSREEALAQIGEPKSLGQFALEEGPNAALAALPYGKIAKYALKPAAASLGLLGMGALAGDSKAEKVDTRQQQILDLRKEQEAARKTLEGFATRNFQSKTARDNVSKPYLDSIANAQTRIDTINTSIDKEAQAEKDRGKPVRENLPEWGQDLVIPAATVAGTLLTRHFAGKSNAEYKRALDGFMKAQAEGNPAEMAVRRTQLADLEKPNIGRGLKTAASALAPFEVRGMETAIDLNKDPSSRAFKEANDRIHDPWSVGRDLVSTGASSALAYGIGSKMASPYVDRSLGRAISSTNPYAGAADLAKNYGTALRAGEDLQALRPSVGGAPLEERSLLQRLLGTGSAKGVPEPQPTIPRPTFEPFQPASGLVSPRQLPAPEVVPSLPSASSAPETKVIYRGKDSLGRTYHKDPDNGYFTNHPEAKPEPKTKSAPSKASKAKDTGPELTSRKGNGKATDSDFPEVAPGVPKKPDRIPGDEDPGSRKSGGSVNALDVARQYASGGDVRYRGTEPVSGLDYDQAEQPSPSTGNLSRYLVKEQQDKEKPWLQLLKHGVDMINGGDPRYMTPAKRAEGGEVSEPSALDIAREYFAAPMREAAAKPQSQLWKEFGLQALTQAPWGLGSRAGAGIGRDSVMANRMMQNPEPGNMQGTVMGKMPLEYWDNPEMWNAVQPLPYPRYRYQYPGGSRGNPLANDAAAAERTVENTPYNRSLFMQMMKEAESAPTTRPPFDVIPGGMKAYGGAIDIARQYAQGGPVAGPIVGHDGGRADTKPIDVASGSYVIPSDIVSSVGDAGGNTLAGMRILEKMFGRAQPQTHMASGGSTPIQISDGEFVLGPDQVARVGNGDLTKGHRVLDALVRKLRADHVKTLKSLPGPAQS